VTHAKELTKGYNAARDLYVKCKERCPKNQRTNSRIVKTVFALHEITIRQSTSCTRLCYLCGRQNNKPTGRFCLRRLPLSILRVCHLPHVSYSIFDMQTEAKYTVRVSKQHCRQTMQADIDSGTHLGGWEGRRLVRKWCGAQPREFF